MNELKELLKLRLPNSALETGKYMKIYRKNIISHVIDMDAFVVHYGASILVSAITAGIVVVLKDVYEYVKNADYHVQSAIRSDMRTKNHLNRGYFVENSALANELVSIFDRASDEGGLYVLGSPAHTGKSVYLQEYLNRYRICKQKYIKFVQFEEQAITISSLKERLGIPNGRKFVEFLPEKSLVIIKFNNQTLNDEMKSFFTILATSSFNSKAFAVIVSVSSSDVYREILRCNNGQKIFPLCNPTLLKFDEEMMRLYIKEIQPEIKAPVADKIIKDCLIHGSVGLLQQVVRSFDGHHCHPPVIVNNWLEFQKIYDEFCWERK